MEKYEDKLKKVKEILQGKKVLVAFSGGVDSSLAAFLAKKYSDRIVAVTARSKTNPIGEIEEAQNVAKELNIEWRLIEIDELEDEHFRANPLNRCYYCKKGLMTALYKIAEKEGLEIIIDGTNADDIKDYRPGMKALKELGIWSPLAEAGFTKQEIREIARQNNLSVHNKPSMACLASRFPYGEEITEQKLQMVAEAEAQIKKLAGIEILRVRWHQGLARIEVAPEDRSKFFDEKLLDNLVHTLKKIGFVYVTLDLQGYRSGSMNEAIMIQ
ncbi:MAG: ATP-dependent sacrificial sulfur transferase LarE [Candidatus Helarchaeota archaeon]